MIGLAGGGGDNTGTGDDTSSGGEGISGSGGDIGSGDSIGGSGGEGIWGSGDDHRESGDDGGVDIARSVATSASNQTGVGTGAGIEILAIGPESILVKQQLKSWQMLLLPPPPRHQPQYLTLILTITDGSSSSIAIHLRLSSRIDRQDKQALEQSLVEVVTVAPRGQVCSLVMRACKATCTYGSSSIQGSLSCSGPTTPGDPISDNPLNGLETAVYVTLDSSESDMTVSENQK
ncbi:hypothetical protein Tco_0281135 [Tanacetum coccineum]